MGSNPTLSAIAHLINPLIRIVVRPDTGWAEVSSAAPGWARALLGHVLPLALLPAIAWPLGHALDPIGPQPLTAASMGFSFATTLGLCAATVVLGALSIYALAPLFGVGRDWNRAFAVAAYSSTPSLLAAPFLISAVLTVIAIVALFHSCVICSFGLQRVLDCRPEDASMYVAAIGVATGAEGMVLGGLCSAAGLL